MLFFIGGWLPSRKYSLCSLQPEITQRNCASTRHVGFEAMNCGVSLSFKIKEIENMVEIALAMFYNQFWIARNFILPPSPFPSLKNRYYFYHPQISRMCVDNDLMYPYSKLIHPHFDIVDPQLLLSLSWNASKTKWTLSYVKTNHFISFS